jgi:putative NADH-flavin reductase
MGSRKLTIVGATGGIGRHLLGQALSAGHDVTALVRDPAKLAARPGRVVVADLAGADPAALRPALAGADAVLSALGPTSRSDAGVTWRGTATIVEAMRATEVDRLVVVSAAPVGTVATAGRPDPPRHDPGDGLVLRSVAYPILKRLLHDTYEDLARMEDVLRRSGLAWTAVRPPRLTDGPRTRDYRIADGRNLRRGLRISRADVADFMLRAVDDLATVARPVGIAY